MGGALKFYGFKLADRGGIVMESKCYLFLTGRLIKP